MALLAVVGLGDTGGALADDVVQATVDDREMVRVAALLAASVLASEHPPAAEAIRHAAVSDSDETVRRMADGYARAMAP